MNQAINQVLVTAIATVTTIAATNIPSAVAQKDPKCLSQITNKPGKLFSGDCIPNALWINPDYGLEYARLMRIAIKAAANQDDYDTAFINFSRAQGISGVTDSEVRRGLLGATLAKAIQKNPIQGYFPSRIWLLVTGEFSERG
jgi:ABC-type sugar transport system substrate-binding protein